MNFLLAKLFEEYQRKNDTPVFSITLYLSVLLIFSAFSMYLPLSVVIRHRMEIAHQIYSKTPLYIGVFVVFLLLFLVVYLKYIRQKYLYTLVEKYRDRPINRFILYFLTAAIPFLIFMTGPLLTVLLIGGTLFNYEIQGIL